MEMDFDLEEIILYLNANEPTGRFCKNVENLKNKLLKSQEQEKVLEIINKKCVDMFNLKIAILQNSVDVYNSSIPIEYEGNKLTQEEFDVLKRWLG